MTTDTAASPVSSDDRSSKVSAIYREGIVAGLIGSATLAIWFLILDAIRGHPLSTPTILGIAIFQGPDALVSPATMPASIEMVLAFTWIHGLVFCAFGGLAAKLLALAEENPNYGYGIFLLMIILEFGFIVLCMVFAEPILRALTWPAILLGNLLATLTMGGYFWRRHPQLSILP